MRALLIDELGDLGRADKADGLDVRMSTDAFDDLFAAIDNVEHAIRQARLFQYLCHASDRQRHKLGRLHYHRVAEHECVGHRPIWHHQRKIEWHDRRDYADRKMLSPAFDAAADLKNLVRYKLRH